MSSASLIVIFVIASRTVTVNLENMLISPSSIPLLNNVGNVIIFQTLPQEGSSKPSTVVPKSGWFVDGRIEFTDFQLRYSSSSPLVLKDVTFSVKPSEKIGIVGRTGSGECLLVSYTLAYCRARQLSILGVTVHCRQFNNKVIIAVAMETHRCRQFCCTHYVTKHCSFQDVV